ncbi:uncharacterized protein LOC124446716 [Xenia sp. Carnegie-2017]|uniref:uncharacterized protein LOC124446716 n=1 Tax=Xenia sp. Carnegie-2017 TaxID=2897299 RepID=UPI001F03DAC9|nr:uncharacterized protein LOC124446716 [Xenia sp. Carnegie-2017]XP_046853535.1 uncharacterized protein LOC124446716 [Xenia sp. Carnegie-2017]
MQIFVSFFHRNKVMAELTFYYDVVCPFAYVASRLIERIAEQCAAKIHWTPVLLNALYKANESQSPMVNSCNAKKIILRQQFARMVQRFNVPINPPESHPANSLSAMRLLAATSCDSKLRVSLTHALFSSYWIENKDITSGEVLQKITRTIGWNVDVQDIIAKSGTVLLMKNTEDALENGAFGVPSFLVNGKLFWGVDNLHFVERELGGKSASPPRLTEPPKTPQSVNLTIYHDLGSPWSFLGSTQVENLIKVVKPVNVTIESLPIVVGSLFKQIGTPVVPMRHFSAAKLTYLTKSLNDWCTFHGIKGFKFPSNFPLKTVLPMRLLLASRNDSELQAALYKAAWIEDKDIGDVEVLREILHKVGFDADKMFDNAQQQDIKDQLRANTDRAVKAGVCGVPSYQVNNGAIIWGQDRLNIVADLLCGWKDPLEEQMNSKL